MARWQNQSSQRQPQHICTASNSSSKARCWCACHSLLRPPCRKVGEVQWRAAYSTAALLFALWEKHQKQGTYLTHTYVLIAKASGEDLHVLCRVTCIITSAMGMLIISDWKDASPVHRLLDMLQSQPKSSRPVPQGWRCQQAGGFTGSQRISDCAQEQLG